MSIRRAVGTWFHTGLLCLLLGACAGRPSIPDIPESQRWPSRQRSVEALADWQLAARVAVRVPETGWSASLYWTQQDESFEIRIIAPLGRGTVLISGDEDTVTLRTTEGVALADEEVAAYLRDQFGWAIPVHALRYWVRGIPDPDAGTPDLDVDEVGRLRTLHQDGWLLAYDRYLKVGETELPTRVTAERAGMSLRLSINRWDIGA